MESLHYTSEGIKWFSSSRGQLTIYTQVFLHVHGLWSSLPIQKNLSEVNLRKVFRDWPKSSLTSVFHTLPDIHQEIMLDLPSQYTQNLTPFFPHLLLVFLTYSPILTQVAITILLKPMSFPYPKSLQELQTSLISEEKPNQLHMICGT